MDAGTTPDLQVALQLGAQMIEAAQAADWERVAGLQSICADHVHSAWPASVQMRDAFQALQEQHLGVLALAAQAHERVGRELSALRGNHRALSAYLDTGNSGN
ncbi:MAG TPA: flagellar protein FliT [Rhodanobacter sp.]|nr:flagellar protein FliT [Rhodanobacter sp.]